jgi:SAM-dependent methyltransferase
VGADERALYRLLRALASHGVFREGEGGRFENTDLSTVLRADVPGSVRDYVIYAANDPNVKAWMRFDEVVKTGKPSFSAANGCTPFEYLRANPPYAQLFSRAMASLSPPELTAALDAYDFSTCGSIVDVGGGYGHVIAAILGKHADLRGAVFDMSVVTGKARELLAAKGLTDRCAILSGDFFESVPTGYDTYLLKHVLHDWSDAESARILANCRAAMTPGKRLLVLDAVLGEGNEPHPAKWLDLHMMTALGGLERTEAQLRELLLATGFRLERIVPTRALVSFVEASAV